MNSEPMPPQASRADALGLLQRERWYAVNNGETAQVAQIDARIAKLSAASAPRSPGRETAAAASPAVEKSAAAKKTAAKKTAARRAATTRGKNRVAER